jgi:uncharacterized protein YfkK (UPF0435 family)
MENNINNSENLVGRWVNLARAYEIALLGNLSIQLMFPPDYKPWNKDYQVIKDFYNLITFKSEGDLIVSINPPDYFDKVEYETLADIHDRVASAKSNDIPYKLTPHSLDMLNHAITKLELSSLERDHIIKVAKIIAQLEDVRTVHPNHIGEAVIYALHDTTMINAENATINFGPDITIALTDLHIDDIKNAINYLQTKLD